MAHAREKPSLVIFASTLVIVLGFSELPFDRQGKSYR